MNGKIAVVTGASRGIGNAQIELVELIKEDLVAERIVIEIYRKLVSYFGNAALTSSRVFEDLLADEDHANDLSDVECPDNLETWIRSQIYKPEYRSLI